jgi:hypothetical protein
MLPENVGMGVNFVSNLIPLFHLHIKSIEQMISFIFCIFELRILIYYLRKFQSVLNFCIN